MDPLFDDISGEQSVVEIESLCMECHDKGVSRFLLTRIPHFKDIVIAAFECPHCGHRNNGVQSATSLADKGIQQSCLVDASKELNRQVVVSEHASISIPDIELEVPPSREKGYLSTIEGVLCKIRDDLGEGQDARKDSTADVFEKIKVVLSRLDSMVAGKLSFTFVIDDPSGNSYIENLCAPNPDPKIKLHAYTQTPEMLSAMGYHSSEDSKQEPQEAPESVYTFHTTCTSCSTPCETRMHMVEIPHFREVIIMATTCDSCGYKTNEVRSGGAVSPLGRRLILSLTCEDDLNRDVLKSETCTLEIPEIDLHLSTNSLGGRFTTLEGLLKQVHDEIQDKVPFIVGDSATSDRKTTLQTLLDNINSICCLELLPATIILDDPLGNSYLQNIYAPDDDPNIRVEEYERSFEQNEELGLNDMKVENYEA